MGISCDICCENYGGTNGPAALKCGHVFHHVCVLRWFTRQEGTKTCPSCRKASRESEITQLYLTINDESFCASPPKPRNDPEKAALRAQLAELEKKSSSREEELERAAVRRVSAEAAKWKDVLVTEKRLRDTVARQLTAQTAELTELRGIKDKAARQEQRMRLHYKYLTSSQKVEKEDLLAAGETRDDLAELLVHIRATNAKYARQINELQDQLKRQKRALIQRPILPAKPTTPEPPTASPSKTATDVVATTSKATLAVATGSASVEVLSPRLFSLPGNRVPLKRRHRLPSKTSASVFPKRMMPAASLRPQRAGTRRAIVEGDSDSDIIVLDLP